MAIPTEKAYELLSLPLGDFFSFKLNFYLIFILFNFLFFFKKVHPKMLLSKATKNWPLNGIQKSMPTAKIFKKL